VLLELEPEELAAFVLQFLNDQGDKSSFLNRYNFGMVSSFERYPREYHEPVAKALMEAWTWLEREGLIAGRPGTTGDWVFVTRRGQKIKAPTDLKALLNADVLPRAVLHPSIVTKILPPFIRGEYDTAVFQSFREVEVAVRRTGRFSELDVGVQLMRAAFDPTRGPLTDYYLPVPEREAMSHLFAGAMGYLKNPQSHRIVGLGDPAAAVEMIAFASFLLRIVDERHQTITQSASG